MTSIYFMLEKFKNAVNNLPCANLQPRPQVSAYGPTIQFSSGPRKSLVPKASWTGKRGKCNCNFTADQVGLDTGCRLPNHLCRHLSACFELWADLCNNFHRRSHGLMKNRTSKLWFQLKGMALWEPNHTIAEASQFSTFADCRTRSPSNQQPLLKGLTFEV